MSTKYKVVKQIKNKGFPTSSRLYHEAHSEASNDEKRKYPSGYQKLKKIDATTPKGKLIGKNSKSGKIKVARSVPKNLRSEVAYHERKENKAIKRLSKEKR